MEAPTTREATPASVPAAWPGGVSVRNGVALSVLPGTLMMRMRPDQGSPLLAR